MMLTDLIPARYRKAVYALYALAATIVGACSIGGVNVGKAPQILAYIGIAVGAVAASNTKADKNEDGAVDAGSLALGILLGVLALWLLHR